ncbi:hypothetical protein CDAR_3761 [Caerostris darwini]|uniref:Uncharacterized protein n=1 Tax=Caerostris darwini TaxID=1538125 RepID=A0AAV4QCH6_9ARAC|nr:hypothetical protein CDAR_465121 [Caerostris darwini]GIY70635.1 hypothetical protein CDAR_3761 [Caerostris darwini]
MAAKDVARRRRRGSISGRRWKILYVPRNRRRWKPEALEDDNSRGIRTKQCEMVVAVRDHDSRSRTNRRRRQQKKTMTAVENVNSRENRSNLL